MRGGVPALPDISVSPGLLAMGSCPISCPSPSTQDFWIVSEPAWLDEKFPNEVSNLSGRTPNPCHGWDTSSLRFLQAKRVGRPCVALVSTNTTWMTFMKLRLDRVLKCELGNITQEEALKSKGRMTGG